MRILYLCADPGIPVLGSKGASLHVRALATALAALGHEVALVAPTLTRTLWEKPAELDLPLEHVPPSDAIGAAARGLKSFAETVGEPGFVGGEVRRMLYNKELRSVLKRRLERCRPDVIFERASLFGTAGAEVAEELGVPLLVELNAPLVLEHAIYRSGALGDLAAAAERFVLTRADVVLPVSAVLADHAMDIGTSPDRVHVLPNGVDPDAFRPGPADPALREALGLDGGPVLGFVGGLRPWHGLEALPALVETLTQRHPTLRLVVAGDGPLRAELGSAFERRGLSAHVVFTGALSHSGIPGLIRSLDIALAPYPAHEHGFYFSPLKLFEYMACGVAVVAPALGQIAEVARSGETALLYPAGDPDAFAGACEHLLEDKALRRGIGEAAAREVRARYTWSRNAEAVVELAEQVTGARELMPA